jgi:hypothetical protein
LQVEIWYINTRRGTKKGIPRETKHETVASRTRLVFCNLLRPMLVRPASSGALRMPHTGVAYAVPHPHPFAGQVVLMSHPMLVQQPLAMAPVMLVHQHQQPMLMQQHASMAVQHPMMAHQPYTYIQHHMQTPMHNVIYREAAPRYREVEVRHVLPSRHWLTAPPRPKHRPPATGSGPSARVAGGFKVLDEHGEQARSDLFYGRFPPSPSPTPRVIDDDPNLARNDPRLLSRNFLARSMSSSSMRRSSSNGSLLHGRLKKTLDDRRSGRPTSRERYLPASYTASLSSSRSLEDLTNPSEFPGTEFGRAKESARSAESPY